MRHAYISFLLLSLCCCRLSAQIREQSGVPLRHHQIADTTALRDTFPHDIPFLLPSQLFIPDDRLIGFEPWGSAPISRPDVYYINIYGFEGSIGFGEYTLQHPDKFFSTLEGRNLIDIPEILISRQMMLGNTLRLGRRLYFLSGILYGTQMGVLGNNWGMGTREGLIFHPSSTMFITLWTQHFQSVTVYSPVIMPIPGGRSAAIEMPATSEVFSFGVQANFIVGDFLIGVGTSISPVPYQKRHHSQFRYK